MSIKFLETLYKKDGLNTSNHFHDCHQILLIENGEVEVNMMGKTRTAGYGNILFFSRFEEHSIRVLKNPYERYVVNIGSDIGGEAGIDYKRFSILFNRPEGFDNILDVSDHFEEIKDIFIRIIKEKKVNGELSAEILELYANELILRLFSYIPSLYRKFGDDKNDLIYKIQRDFETNYAQDVTLEDLSKKYGISQSYLSHIFKSATGKSVKGYLLECRVAAAKRYLVGSNNRISDVVEACGFSDCSNFSRLFKTMTGYSPVDFRKKYQSEGIETVE